MKVQTQPRRGGNLWALKALVGGMGVLIVLGTAVVIAVVAQRIYASPATPSMTAAVPANAVPAFELPAGAHIAGIAGAGGSLAVWITGPAGDQLLLVNPANRQVSTVIAPSSKAPSRPLE